MTKLSDSNVKSSSSLVTTLLKPNKEFFDDFTKISEWGKSEQCEFLYIWEEYGTESGNHHYHAIVQIPHKDRTRCDTFANKLDEQLGLTSYTTPRGLGTSKAVEYRHKLEKRDAFKRFCPDPNPAMLIFLLGSSWVA